MGVAKVRAHVGSIARLPFDMKNAEMKPLEKTILTVNEIHAWQGGAKPGLQTPHNPAMSHGRLIDNLLASPLRAKIGLDHE